MTEGLLEKEPSQSPAATALPKKYGGHRIIIALRGFSVDDEKTLLVFVHNVSCILPGAMVSLW